MNLDAPVRNYVAGFPEEKWPITTRQLMAHTAGIRPRRGEGGILRGDNCTTDLQRLNLFAADSLVSRPGTRYRYSTHGWALVGAVIASTSNEPYLDFLQREVLTPLGMEHTVPDLADQEQIGRAHFYYPRMMLNPGLGLHDSPKVDLSCHLPAVGFLSTPADLVRLGSAMMSDDLLEAATIQELQTTEPLESGDSTGEALGWTVQSLPLGIDEVPTRVVGQGLGEVVRRRPLSAETVDGQVAGATAMLLTIPEHRIAIAVTTNTTGSDNVRVLAFRLADAFVRFLQAR